MERAKLVLALFAKGDPVNVWPFIEVEEAEQRNGKRACDLLEVSRSASYEQRNHTLSRRAVTDAELTEKIIAIHETSKGTYGAPRVHAELRRAGFHLGKKRVARLMRQAGLAGRARSGSAAPPSPIPTPTLGRST